MTVTTLIEDLEFTVNTETDGDQEKAIVTALTGGGYVVVWESRNQDGDKLGVYGQRYDASGATVGGEFRVNTETECDQKNISITALDDGGYVVVWDSKDQDGDKLGVYGQQYNASGAAVGGEFRVNSETEKDQAAAIVTALTGGGYVVVWESKNQDGDKLGVYGQQYDASGTAVGGEFRVNTETEGDQKNISITALNDGGYVVVWESKNQDGDKLGVYGQQYDASGAAVGGEFQVNSETEKDQAAAIVTALTGGGYVVVWESKNQDGDKLGVYGQQYDASGATVGGEFQVNTETEGDQKNISITALNDGGYVVVWESKNQDGDKLGVYGQQYDASGAAVGGEFQVNSETEKDQAAAIVTALTSGGYVVVWESKNQDGDKLGVYGQRYDVSGATVGGEFQVNTETEGDQKNISVAALEGGGFVVTWESADADKTGVFAKQFLDVDDEAPAIVANAGLLLDEGATATLAGLLLSADPDTDDATLVYDIAGLTNGRVELSTGPGAPITSFTQAELTSGLVVYVHDGGETIADSFTFTVRDTASPQNVLTGQTFAITVTPVNDAPSAGAVGAAAEEDGLVITTSFAGDDVDSDDDASTVTYAIISQPAEGSATVNALDPTKFDFDPGGDFQNLAAGETRDVTFEYTATDSHAVVSAAATVTVTVTGTNDAPSVTASASAGFTEDLDASTQDLTDSGTVAFDDIDATDLVDISFASNSDIAWSGGTLDPALGAALVAGFSTGVTDAAAPGTTPWSYNATGFDLDFLAAGETITWSYEVTATDSVGATATDNVTMTLAGTNDAPTIAMGGLPFQSSYNVGDIVAGTTDLTGLVINGVGANDGAGRVVAGAGDLNGDGIDDVIAATSTADIDGLVNVGATYVVFGAPGISGPINLADLDGTSGFRVSGIDPGDMSGNSASFAGDVNDDGINDLIIGATGVDQGSSSNVGQVYVIYGATTFAASFDLLDLDGSNGFQIDGIDYPNGVDRLGHAVSSAGDVNGDGIDDFIMGADAADPGGVQSRGEAYVVFGSASFGASFDLTTLDGTNGFRLPGLDFGDFAGRAVSSAGDVNGDGYDDIIVGVHAADANGNGSGETYVVFGAPNFQPTFDFASLDGTNGFTVPGVSAGDLSGQEVAGLGDINGDGIDDMVVGTQTAEQAYVIFGTTTGFDSVVNPPDLDGTIGFRIKGVDSGDRAGTFVSTPGDVNNDGINDIIISAIAADPDGNDLAGETYVIFGGGPFGAEFELSSLDGSNGYRIDGIDPGDESGFHATTAGDLNKDGIDDFIFGATGGDPSGVSNGGESYVIFGREGSLTDRVVTEISDGGPGEGSSVLSTGASFEFVDLDLADTHSVSFQFVSATHSALGSVAESGTFAVNLAQQSGGGIVDWAFSIADAILDPLDDGESVVQVYDILIDDGTDMVVQQVNVTMFGADDF